MYAFWGNKRTGQGFWSLRSEKIGTVAPGGGRGKRVTARAECNPVQGLVSWKNEVDVEGQRDWGAKQRKIKEVRCAPK